MSVPERDLNQKPTVDPQEWLSRQLFGNSEAKKNSANEWVAACLLTLLQPPQLVKDTKDVPAKPKDAPKAAPDDWQGRTGDRAVLKGTMRKSMAAINAVIDAKKEAAIKEGKTPEKLDEKIDIDAVEKELDEGRFGPKTVAALKRVVAFLQDGTVKHLKILDRYGLDIPAGCPLEPPLDKSGRHIGDELFRAKLAKDEIVFDIFKKALEEGKPPDSEAIARLAKAEVFIIESQGRLRSASIRCEAGKLLAEIHSFEDPKKPETMLTGWYPKKELMERDPNETPETRRQKDIELEKWIAATTTALEPAQKQRNYAQTIAFLHYISGRRTESDFERWISELPTVQRVIARSNGLDDKERIFPDDALKPENFPGTIERDPKTGLVTLARPYLPPNPERSREYRDVVGKTNAWLDKYGGDVDQIQQELALLIATGATYKEGHPKAGQPILSLDKMMAVSEDEYPEKKDADGQPIRYPTWQRDKEGRKIGGQEVPEFNFCKRSIEVTKEGDEYVIRPYKQYYWARDYAYNHWNVGGDWNIPFTNFNVGAMQPAGERIYTREEPVRLKGHQFALCIENGRLEFVPANKMEVWAKAAESGEDVGKYVALTVDIALLLTASYEAKGAELLAKKAAQEGVEVAAKQAMLRAYRGQMVKAYWHYFLAGTGFGRQSWPI
jgi:hypothetical protein